jgi:hypothetical protein
VEHVGRQALVDRVASFAAREKWTTERTLAAIAAVLSNEPDSGGFDAALCGEICRVGSGDGPHAAHLLGMVYERLLHPGARRARGAHFTPADVAEHLVSFALDGVELREQLRIVDPSCGGGAFLLATAAWLHAHGWSRAESANAVWGADIDPLAVWVSTTALALWAGADTAGADNPVADTARDGEVAPAERIVCADVLDIDVEPWPGVSFDAVIGNPPFQNQLERATVRSAAQRRQLDVLGTARAPYVDSAALFLPRALDLVADGGRVALIQPHSTLVARDARSVRETITTRADLVGLWFARESIFAASVRVCAPVLQRVDAAGDRASPPLVRRALGRAFAPVSSVPPPASADSWAGLASDLLDVPQVHLAGNDKVGHIATATAGFRDEYYGLVGAVLEASGASTSADRTARLVTCGLIDVLANRWGSRPATFAHVKYAAPVVDVARLEGRVAAWVDAQLVPKLLVATQTKVLEVVVDETGHLVPSTPVIAVHAPREMLWHLAAALSAPCVSAHALGRVAGAALAADAIKLAARQVLELPLPQDHEAWDRGAVLARAAQHAGGGERERLLDALGTTMDQAYGCDDRSVFAWWAARR